MTKTITLSVGQQVFIKLSHDYLKPATVTKIGTKWTTLETSSSYKSQYRARNRSRDLEGTGSGYSSEGTIYLSESEYQDQQATEAAWKSFRGYIGSHYGCPNLTAEQIQYMYDIVESTTK